jgi:TetR/AcrR family transcriptional repressor of nem operon
VVQIAAMAPAPRKDTARRILDVALRLVQVHGFNAFSYADIAAELHITKASLHHHFPTKAALGKALITRYKSAFAQALEGIDRRGGDARAKLKSYADIYVNVLRQERMCLCGMLAADFETLPKAMRHGVTDFFSANEAWLTKVLEDGRRAGALRFEGSASSMAEFLVSSLEGAMLVARTYDDVPRFESVVGKLLGGLGARA